MLLSLVVAGFFLFRDGGVEIVPSPDPPTSAGADTSARGAAAADLVRRLQAGLATGSRREVLALAAPGSAQAGEDLGQIFDNVRELGLTGLTLRYVDENQGPPGGAGWRADVQVGWRIAGFDRRPSRMEVSFTFTRTSGGMAFLSVGDDPDTAVPLWLLDEVAVERSRRALVMVVEPSRAAEFSSLAERAVADVKQVLPRWRGKLVVEIPASQEALERTLGAEDGAYEAIAAVTSTVDGSLEPSSPAHILVNPAVFTRLSPPGAQIVLSHEAAHVATAVATSTMPMWLLEGFADYVALAHVELPVSTTASQILAEVRRDGPPAKLPSAGQFDPANKALGTSYEAAWLACRLIGARYGEQQLITFYDAVDDGLPVEAAFAEILDTDQRTFTARWRDYLRRLAAR